MNFVMSEVKVGINVLLCGINHTKLAAAANSSVQNIPLTMMNLELVMKVLDRVLSKLS